MRAFDCTPFTKTCSACELNSKGSPLQITTSARFPAAREPTWSATPAKRAAPTAAPSREKKRKLSFRERAELDALPEQIDARERERETVYASLADPALLRDGGAVVEAQGRLAALSAEIESLIARWEELEMIAAG